jgi:hypothetical protein
MWKKILIVFFLVTAVFVFAKDKLIELMTEGACRVVTGARLDIERMKVSLMGTVIDIKGMKVYNPENFPYELMADVPEVYADYDLSEISRGVIRFKKLRFYLKTLNVVRNFKGEVNLDSLKPVSDQTSGSQIEAKAKGKVPDVQIDVFELKADKAFYRDYSGSKEPVVVKFDIGIDERYENINDPYTLIRLIISRVLNKTAVSNIVNMPMKEVQKVLAGAYEAGSKVVSAATGAAGKLFGGTGDTLKSIEKAVKNPFSKPKTAD